MGHARSGLGTRRGRKPARPVRHSGAAAASFIRSRPHTQGRRSITMKILIVDDSTAMRMIVKKTLRLAGFEGHTIVEAEDGGMALDAIKESMSDLLMQDLE